MRKNIIIFLALTSVLFFSSVFAEEKYKTSNTASGKEIISFDGTSKVVAKGTQVTTSGNVTSIESFKANVSRRIALAERQIEQIKANQTSAEEKIKQLKNSLRLEQKARNELANKIKELKDKLDSLKSADSDKN